MSRTPTEAEWRRAEKDFEDAVIKGIMKAAKELTELSKILKEALETGGDPITLTLSKSDSNLILKCLKGKEWAVVSTKKANIRPMRVPDPDGKCTLIGD